MNDSYHYKDGAIHNDHKRVLHIGSIGSGDVTKLLDRFFREDVEEAEYEEANTEPQCDSPSEEPASEASSSYDFPLIPLQQLLKQ